MSSSDSRNHKLGSDHHSDHPTSMSDNSLSIQEGEIDVINKEDLADVDNDISLGTSGEESDGDLSSGTPTKNEASDDSKLELPRGYIDDAITKDVMKNADKRLAANKPFPYKKVGLFLVCAAGFLAIVIGVALGTRNIRSRRQVEKRIKDKTSAYDFDDRDDYKEPTADATGTSKAGTTKDGTTKNKEGYRGPNGDGDSTIEAKEFVQAGPGQGEDTTGKDTEEYFESGIWYDEIPLVEDKKVPIGFEENLLDPRQQANDTITPIPIFWQVPFGGGVFQSYMTGCLNKVLASNHKLKNEDALRMHRVKQSAYINTDLSTVEGIDLAAEQHLAETQMADVFVSNHIFDATTKLLDPKYQGRLFTAFKHPVDRSIDEYHYTVTTNNEYFVRNMGLEEYAHSSFMDKDWMVRFLIDKQQGHLDEDDLKMAKEILRKKCLIGLHENIQLSLDFFEEYFGWYSEKGEFNKKVHDHCRAKLMEIEEDRAREVFERVGPVQRGSDIYKIIVELNSWDMKLYWYAYDLFTEQQVWFATNHPMDKNRPSEKKDMEDPS